MIPLVWVTKFKTIKKLCKNNTEIIKYYTEYCNQMEKDFNKNMENNIKINRCLGCGNIIPEEEKFCDDICKMIHVTE